MNSMLSTPINLLENAKNSKLRYENVNAFTLCYGGFYGECEYGGCEYGECEYGESVYGGCDYGECDYCRYVSVRVWPMG